MTPHSLPVTMTNRAFIWRRWRRTPAQLIALARHGAPIHHTGAGHGTRYYVVTAELDAWFGTSAAPQSTHTIVIDEAVKETLHLIAGGRNAR